MGPGGKTSEERRAKSESKMKGGIVLHSWCLELIDSASFALFESFKNSIDKFPKNITDTSAGLKHVAPAVSCDVELRFVCLL